MAEPVRPWNQQPIRAADASAGDGSGHAVSSDEFGQTDSAGTKRWSFERVKRALDVLGSGAALLLLWPVLLLVAVAIRLDSPGPAIFRQVRVGLKNTHFVIYKFRTMRSDTPDVAKSQLSRADSRITHLGRILRRTSLDELPQFFNVLKGDMSLVGPRPALYNQHDLIDMRTKAGVHLVKPGLTGLAQISGREDLSLPRKVELDQYYAAHASIWLDLRLLFQTPFALLSPRGTY
jgi:O-antigen biosynthesis protein WbqP